MDDLLDAARSGINGTVADFSNWNGVKEGDFKHMKINSSEKVIEPIDENTEFDEQKEIQEIETPKEPETKPEVNISVPPKEREEQNFKERPGVQQAYLNPVELKNISIKLMPTVDVLMANVHEPLDRNIMRNVSEAAINLAFEFLQVWNEKVSVEKSNG